MGIFENFKSSAQKIRSKIEEFKGDHKMANEAISEIVNFLPPPFDSFGKIIWNGLEKEDDSAQKMLVILDRIEKNSELQFMRITGDISRLLENNATRNDIIDIGKKIRESENEIITILESKLEEILTISKKSLEGINKIQRDVQEMKHLMRQIDANKKIGKETKAAKQENYLSLYNKGNDLLTQGKLNPAIKYYRKSLKLAPDCYNALAA